MTNDARLEIEDRLDQLELKIDRLMHVVGRVADDLDTVTALRESLDAGFAEAKADNQRAFGDLRNAIRHFGVRISESERCRLR